MTGPDHLFYEPNHSPDIHCNMCGSHESCETAAACLLWEAAYPETHTETNVTLESVTGSMNYMASSEDVKEILMPNKNFDLYNLSEDHAREVIREHYKHHSPAERMDCLIELEWEKHLTQRILKLSEESFAIQIEGLKSWNRFWKKVVTALLILIAILFIIIFT